MITEAVFLYAMGEYLRGLFFLRILTKLNAISFRGMIF